MNNEFASFVHKFKLPKDFRFQTFNGQIIFEAINQDGSPRTEYVINLLMAPNNISDYELKRSDVIAHKSIVFTQKEAMNENYEDLCRLIQVRISEAVVSLQSEMQNKMQS